MVRFHVIIGLMTMRLNSAAIERLAIPDRGYAIEFDDVMPGLGVLTTNAGHRSWILQTRATPGRKGKMCRITLGSWGRAGLTVYEARQRAAEVRGLLLSGESPESIRASLREHLI